MLLFSPTIKMCLSSHFFFYLSCSWICFTPTTSIFHKLYFQPPRSSENTPNHKSNDSSPAKPQDQCSILTFLLRQPSQSSGRTRHSHFILSSYLFFLFLQSVFILHQGSLFSHPSSLGILSLGSHLQNKFSCHRCTDCSDLSLCSGSVSFCSKESLSLTPLSMGSCQLTLNGTKPGLIFSPEPSTTTFITMDQRHIQFNLCSVFHFELSPV